MEVASPETIRREIWIHWLAYNLIRKVMAQAALTREKLPRELSFVSALAAVSVGTGTTRYVLPVRVTVPDSSATMVLLINQRVPGAIVAVPANTFVHGQPVAQAARGLTPEQIEKLAGTTGDTIDIVAPSSGTIVERKVYPGQYVKEGDALFEIGAAVTAEIGGLGGIATLGADQR